MKKPRTIYADEGEFDHGAPRSFAALDSIRKLLDERQPFGYGTVLVDGRRYTMREDFQVVMERHAAKFGTQPAKGK